MTSDDAKADGESIAGPLRAVGVRGERVSDEVVDCIVSCLAGQNHFDTDVASKYDVAIWMIEEIMVDAGYERCSACDHWFEAGELVDDGCNGSVCEGCK